MNLTRNALNILEKRYLLKDEKGRIKENPEQMFSRVAKAIANVDKIYGEEVSRAEEEFYNIMVALDFLPNSPTLMNAGTEIGQLSACFALPIEDSIIGIFDALKNMAIIHKSGGGTGFSFSSLRPKNDIVKTTHGVASGPVSFMKIFDVSTEIIKQGGRRRGANMGCLRIDHPDIIEFILAKTKGNAFSNFNLSVLITDKFMRAVKKNKDYYLINPRTGKKTKKLNAYSVFNLIVNAAWKTGDPGLIFIDEINRHNPTPQLGEIETTNPCGELPLLFNESCNLGSINLSHMVRNNQIDWDKLAYTIDIAVHFLDNIIDANQFPLPQIEKITKGNRKIGLGVMGFAEMLIKLGIPYNSPRALKTAESIMKFLSEKAHLKSQELAKKRGPFPNFKNSIYQQKNLLPLRNATLTTIAPTGSISIIAGTSSSIEPLFAVVFFRQILEGTKFFEINHLFEKIARQKGFYSKEIMLKIARQGTLSKIKEIPTSIKNLFVTALEIQPETHVKIQAAFQKYTDNAVSKTINLAPDSTPNDVYKAFFLAWELKCKGITVYRYGSKKEQVLYLPQKSEKYVKASSEYTGECRTCNLD